MKIRTKHILRAVCFALIFLVVFSYVAEVFRKESWESVKTFYDEPKDSLDVVFIGPSTTYHSIYPMELWNDYGIAAYDFSTPSQSLPSSYYAVQEVIDRQHPKLIVLDVFMTVRTNEKINGTAFQHYFTDTLRFSDIKINCINDLIDGDKSEFFLPFISYHSRWSELIKSDFDFKPNYGKGIRISYTASPINMHELVSEKEISEPYEVPTEYLLKIIDYCEKNNVELCLTAPVSNLIAEEQTRYNKIAQIAEEHNISFLNLRRNIDEIGIDPQKDFKDFIHPNAVGAEKITDFMGKYLRENYNLPDRRNEPDYDNWYEDYETYKLWINNFRINYIKDINEYLSAINMDSYTVVISAKDEVQRNLNSEIVESLKKLGLSPLTKEEFGYSYIAILDSGKVVYEEKQKEGINTDQYIDGVHYVVQSEGWHAGKKASIVVNTIECAKGRRGLNIVVYDKWSGEVVDRVCFDTNVKDAPCYR